MADLTGILGAGFLPAERTVEHLSNAKAGKDLDMNDFLQLMVATFQNQSIDNTADISDMMNQMVQMSVIQAVTNLSNLVSESTSMSYAASLVGKQVTVGQYIGKELQEIRGTVTGTGTLNGQQVIFLDDDETYYLTDIMAVCKLPDIVQDAAAPQGETGGTGAGASSGSGSENASGGAVGSLEGNASAAALEAIANNPGIPGVPNPEWITGADEEGLG